MKLRNIIITLVATFAILISGVTPVAASGDADNGIGVCDFIGPICTALGISNGEDAGTAAASFVRERLTLVVSFLFLGIILISVYIIIKNGLKYIQSQGVEGEIEAAQKAIKSVFIGIGVLFVGIVGIILVLAFFNASGLFTTEVESGNDLLDAFSAPSN